MSDGSIVLAGGGTGGHISPGIAIAERLAEIAPQFDRVFACSTRAVDARMLEHVGADYVPIQAEGLSPQPLKLMRFVRAFVAGRAAARDLLAERGARVVIALGGYVTGPVVMAAHSMRVPVLLVNLDATPGNSQRQSKKLTVDAESKSRSVRYDDEFEACFPLIGIALGRREIVEDGTAYLNWAERKAQLIAAERAGLQPWQTYPLDCT